MKSVSGYLPVIFRESVESSSLKLLTFCFIGVFHIGLLGSLRVYKRRVYRKRKGNKNLWI